MPCVPAHPEEAAPRSRLRALWSDARLGARLLTRTDFPLLAQLIVTRRCNLRCGYCTEYDTVSQPVPLAAIKRRIAALARLETGVVTLTGGEPLLHPDLPEIVAQVRRLGMHATMITNGTLLTERWIEALNSADLDILQISIDNLRPDRISGKSLRGLDRKLKLLAEHARFKVNVNCVLGVSEERTEDAIQVARRAMHYGFSHSVGVLHDAAGKLEPLSPRQKAAYHEIGRLSRSWVHWFNYHNAQKNLMEARPNRWKCRAGARYLYVCEDGLVHWCAQQRGYPGIPVESYTVEDIRREFDTPKDCAKFCTLNCVHQASFLDNWRGQRGQAPG